MNRSPSINNNNNSKYISQNSSILMGSNPIDMTRRVTIQQSPERVSYSPRQNSYNNGSLRDSGMIFNSYHKGSEMNKPLSAVRSVPNIHKNINVPMRSN